MPGFVPVLLGTQRGALLHNSDSLHSVEFDPSGRLTLRWLLVAVLSLIAYGTLFPFDFSAIEVGDATWHAFVTSWKPSTDRLGDILSNVALFVPVGFLAVWGFEDRRWPTWIFLAVVGIVAMAFALVLQYGQLYIPNRVPAISDAVWNLLGVMLGGLAAPLIGRIYQRGDARIVSPPLVPVMIVAAWCLVELLPLVPSLDFQGFKDGIKPIFSNRMPLSEVLRVAVLALLACVALNCISPRLTSPLWLALLLAATAFGKALVVQVVLDRATLVGFASAFTVWMLVRRTNEGRRDAIVTVIALVGLSAVALSPFDFTFPLQSIEWIPFQSYFTGGTLDAARAICERLVIYGGICWLLWRRGGFMGPAVFVILIWATMLELAQTLLPARTATLTEPIMVIICGWLVWTLDRFNPLSAVSSPRSSKDSRETRGMIELAGRFVAQRGTPAKAAWSTGLTCVVLASGFWVLLRLPGIPYNVSELVRFDGNFVFLLIFALALLSFGGSGRWIGDRIAKARHPWLTLPITVMVAALATLLLLAASVTGESLADVAGSSNIYWFVVNKQIWGEWGSALFVALDAPGVISILERYVRFTALVGPLFIVLGVMYAGRECVSWRRFFLIVASCVPWMWLCKGIAFDWSSTDNLNELIARPGKYRLGGGGYLYLLLILFCINVVVLSDWKGGVRKWGSALAITMLAVPVGWWLLNAGLEQHIRKYSGVFSGTQFLLGPDRATTLSANALFVRWCAVYLGALLVLWLGGYLVSAWRDAWLRWRQERQLAETSLENDEVAEEITARPEASMVKEPARDHIS